MGDSATVRERFKELDGLRGLAALGVVLSHFMGGYDSKFTDGPEAPFPALWGAYGVQLFFLISGYVILMSAHRSTRPSDFVISRASRLYPVYWFALIQSIILTVAFSYPHSQMSWLERLLNFTMIQRLLLIPNVDEVYWTLAIEMQFYFLIFFLLHFSRCKLSVPVIRWVGVIWVSFSLICSALFGQYSRGIDPQLVWTPVKIILNLALVEWAPLFIAGMFAYLAISTEGRERRTHRIWSLSMSALALVVFVLLHGWSDAWLLLLVLAVFQLVTSRRRTRILLVPPIQWYGKVSYSLYIGHNILGLLVIYWLIPWVGRPSAMLLAFVAVSLNAALLHQLGEVRGTRIMRRSLLRFRQRLDARRGTA